MLLASVSLFAQTNVSGVVTGADGVPIPGVAVLIQGTKTGQATGIDGGILSMSAARIRFLRFPV